MYFEKRPAKKSKKGYTWTVLFYYTDLNGFKKRYKKSGFETKQEAKAHGLQMLEEINQSGTLPAAKTLKDVWTEWEALNTDRLAPNTMINYRKMWEYLEPFHNKPIKYIQYGQLQELFNSLDLSKGTKGIIKALLMNLFKHAIKNGWTHNNPVQFIECTGAAKEPERVLDLAEVEKICDHIRTTDDFKRQAYETFVWIGYYTGLRLGEIAALEWSDIDLEGATITVSKRQDPHTNFITEQLKTKSSYSKIPMCEPLKAILMDWRTINPNDYVICARSGAPIPNNTIGQNIRRAGDACGIPCHPHLLRHTFVTNLIRSGLDPKTAAQLARHSNVNITLDVYTQMDKTDLKRAIETAFPDPKKAPKSPILAA